MSQESSSEKTEEATPKKLRDARKKGQVTNSKDIPSAIILLLAALYFWMNWDLMLDNLKEMFHAAAAMSQVEFARALEAGLDLAISKALLGVALPFAAIVTVAAILGNILQFGFVFSFDPVMPRMSKINPAEGFKRIFSIKQFVQTIFSLAKTIVIAIAMFYVIYLGLHYLLNDINQCNLICQKEIIEGLVGTLFLIVLPLIITMAILDFIFQRAQFMKEQRMTKDEIKREFKEMFGDPHVVGERRQLRRELAENDIRGRIKTARLVIVDIGLTIALHFEQDVTPLPVIVAIGRDQMARKMTEIAQLEHVPMLQDPRLAELLATEGKVDQYIPQSSIDAVAQAMRRKPKNK